MNALNPSFLSNVDIIWQLLLIFITASAHYFVGAIFFRASFFTLSIAGLCINAALVTILVSFISAAAKPAVVIILLLTINFAMIKLYFDQKKLPKYILQLDSKIILNLLCAFLIFLLIFHIYDNSVHLEPNIFNGHENYFSGISLEILRAEYFSRLRIFDNYPVAWSRYHFFNGALASLPQLFIFKSNLYTFMAAKICLITFFIFSIIELSIRSNSLRKYFLLAIICIIYIFTMLPNQLWWAIGTNAYSSTFLLIITLLCWKKNLYNLAMFFALVFGLSTSRSVIPGIFLFIAMLYFMPHKENLFSKLINGFNGISFINFRHIFLKQDLTKISGLYALLLIAITIMIFSGNPNSTPFKLNYSNFFDEGWIYIMSPSITQANLAMNSSPFLKPNYWWIIFWLSVLIFTILNSSSIMYLRRIKFLIFNSKHKNLIIILTIFLIIVSLFVRVFKPYQFQIFILYFIIPTSLATILVPNKTKYLVIIFIVASVFQVVIFQSSISIPNYIIVEWIVLFGFLYQISFMRFNIKLFNISFFCFFVFICYLFSQPLHPKDIFKFSEFDSTTHILPDFTNRFKFYDDLKLIPFCFTNSDIDAALIAANGNRVTFASYKSDRYSMSKPFAIPTKEDLLYINQICK
jgi:hypothetical protein